MKIRTLAAAAAAFIAAGTAACGSAAPPRPPTLGQAIQASGCGNIRSVYYHGEMFTTVTASCTINGVQAEIAVFPGPASQKEWETIVKAEGAVIIKDGTLWALSSQ